MFWLFRVLFGVFILGTAWFCYDFFSHQSEPQSQALKVDFNKLLDSGEISPLFVCLKGQMSEDFNVRFWPKVKKAFRVLKEDEAKE